jgi:3-dehydroquinate synthase
MDQRFDFVRRQTSRIVLGRDVAARLPGMLRELGARSLVLVHDEVLTPTAEPLAAAIGARLCIALPGGEQVKSLAQVGALASRLRASGADRGTTLVALGGGTIVDLVGFVASVWLRSVPFVALPTTTLALCDAALGGKNGVDHDGRKNELGTIRQPDLIAGDIAWLRSLPDDVFAEGFVEAAKMAAVLDAERFSALERLAPRLRARDDDATLVAIGHAAAMKMAVVVADETEQDRRRWLNFGHTIGHALESLAAGALRHGPCVAIGMLAECRAAADHVPAAVHERLRALLQALGAPVEFPRAFADAAQLWSLAQHDKKARDGVVPMIVPTAIGSGTVVPLDAVRLAKALA